MMDGSKTQSFKLTVKFIPYLTIIFKVNTVPTIGFLLQNKKLMLKKNLKVIL